MPSDFDDLMNAAYDDDVLLEAYDQLLNRLFQDSHWRNGPISTRRVHWFDGDRARKEDRNTFNSPGLYIWGCQERPLYLGKAETLRKRFSRYIWQRRSQCKLAEQYGPQLVSGGLEGFPTEVRDWYKRCAGNSTVRLSGAVRFAEEGIEHVWFALLPHTNPNEIRTLEAALIQAAAEWNHRKGLKPLLNVQRNRRR